MNLANETLSYRYGTIIDAVAGKVIASGTPPISNYEPVKSELMSSSEPVGSGSNPEVFLLGGPYDIPNCSGGWYDEALDAAAYFEEMGYSTLTLEYPNTEVIETYISNFDTAIFVEMSHSGGASYFRNGCPDKTYDEDMRAWMADYPKMPFSLLYGCYIACSPAPEEEYSISGALMKGSSEDTAVVGFCALPEAKCDTCYEWDWTWEFLKWLKLGQTVENAYGIACTAVPGCCIGDYPCARKFGDPNLRLVPQKVYRNPNVEGAVTGEVRDVNGDLLSNVVVSLSEHGGGFYDSDVASPNYSIEVDQTGEYWLSASKSGFATVKTNNLPPYRNPYHPDYIDFTTPGLLAAGYNLDFEGDYGLVPRACNMSYAMESINHWLFTPFDASEVEHPEWQPSNWKAAQSVHSWQYPS